MTLAVEGVIPDVLGEKQNVTASLRKEPNLSRSSREMVVVVTAIQGVGCGMTDRYVVVVRASDILDDGECGGPWVVSSLRRSQCPAPEEPSVEEILMKLSAMTIGVGIILTFASPALA
jgi:hypothetical protein